MIYRCKNCGQRIVPEVNTICPVCKTALAGNIEKDTSSDKVKKSKTPLVLLLLTVLVVGGLYFSGYGQKILNRLKNDFPKDVDTIISEIDVDQAPIGISNSNPSSTKLAYYVDTYFIYFDQMEFGESIAKIIESMKSLMVNENGILTLVSSEYENGDVWLRLGDPYGTMLFAPTEVVEIEGSRRQLLIPILDTVDYVSAMLPNSSYLVNNGDFDLDGKGYEVKKKKVYELLEKQILGEEEIDAFVIVNKTYDQLTLQNIHLKYSFEEYSKIQTENGIVYEDASGKRYSNYIELPHSIIIDQEKSKGITELYSEIKIQ